MAPEPPEELLVHNYNVEAPLPRSLPPRVVFWDETLRDGEQTPGVYFTPEEKVELARLLSDLGVGILNAGIPAVSDQELQAVKAIAHSGLKAAVLAAARTVKPDIDAVLKSDAPEIAAFIAASPVHIRYKLRMTEDEVLRHSVEAVEYARDHGLKVTYVTEDTVRADLDFAAKLYDAAIEAGAERILYCDTVGVATPPMLRWWIAEIRKRVRLRGREEGVHLHNDFGMATANSLAALEMGVPVINTALAGLGERAGNAPFDEVVLALEILYGHRTGVKVERIYEVTKRVEELAGFPVAMSKPITGYNAFTHESGIHTDGVIKHTLTYEPIQVEALGRRRRFVFGKHTGARAVRARLEAHGLQASDEQVKRVVQEVKDYTERHTKREVQGFVKVYREWDAHHKGVAPRVFWEMCERAGVKLPRGFDRDSE